jgi:hypothetical protein
MKHEPRIAFDAESHTYRVNGVVKRNVTTILASVARKDGVEFVPVSGDARFFQNDKTASIFGKEFHKAIAICLRGQVPDIDPQMRPWWEQFKKFYYDNEALLAGERGPIIIDWKTGTTEKKHWRLQTAAYMPIVWAANENRLIEYMGYAPMLDYCGTVDFAIKGKPNCPCDRWTVRFDEDGYEIDKRTTRDSQDLSGFMSCLNVLNLDL